MNIKKLIIIGNGMDIDHGFDFGWKQIYNKEVINGITGFSKKLDFLFSEKLEKNLWSDFEKTLGLVINIWNSSLLKEECAWRGIDRNYKFNQAIEAEQDYIRNVCKEFCDQVIDLKLDNEKAKEEFAFKFCKDKKIEDYSLSIKKQLIIKIREEIIKKESTLKAKEKYMKIFREKDFFVVNYNYSEFYHKKLNYYLESDVAHIHGTINENTSHEFNVLDEIISKDLADIKLGMYDNWTRFSACGVDMKKLGLVKNEDNEESVSCFSKAIGNSHLYFRKAYSEVCNDKKHARNKDFTKIEEAIIIGHSLSGNDLPHLLSWIPAINLDQIKKVTYYSFYKPSNSYNREAEKNKILKSFKNVKKIVIYNNGDASNEPLDTFTI